MKSRGRKSEDGCQNPRAKERSGIKQLTSDLPPLTSKHSSKRGQTLIFMTMVVVMIAFAALFYFDVHKVLHVKAVSRNGGDAAALAGARWQAISLNLTGSLNIALAQAHIHNLSNGQTSSPEADLLADLQRRIAFSGPMYGYISAQQAAKRNGLFNQQDFARAVYNHASVVRSEYGLIHSEPFTPSGAYGSAWEEVADMLELAADHGVAVEAAWQYYASYANMNHLLLNPGFYDAVAGRSWCWFYFNAFNELQNYTNYTYWDDLPPRIMSPPQNSEVLSLWVRRVWVRSSIPVLPSGSTWASTMDRLRAEVNNLFLTDLVTYGEFNADWAYYNSSRWNSWESRIPENFPWDGEIRPEFDYAGADSAVAVRAETERHTNFRGADTIDWTAGAKPFGSLEGGVTPNLYGLVLPAYSDVRLIPVDTTSGGSGLLRPGWIHFIMNILPAYIEYGPSTLPAGNWYANQLLTWEEPSMATKDRSSKSGQAVVEFCIGLIGMLAVIAGIVQLGRMGLGRMNARVEATSMASAASMTDEPDVRPVLSYIHRMDEAADQRSYSVDDRAQTGDPNEVYLQILRPNQPGVLRNYAPGNTLAGLSDTLDMMSNTGLVPGTGVEANIPVMPIVRRLFFDEDSVTIEVRAWSVRTGGLY